MLRTKMVVLVAALVVALLSSVAYAAYVLNQKTSDEPAHEGGYVLYAEKLNYTVSNAPAPPNTALGQAIIHAITAGDTLWEHDITELIAKYSVVFYEGNYYSIHWIEVMPT